MARSAVTNQRITGTSTVAKNLTNFTLAGWINYSGGNTMQSFGFGSSNIHNTYIGWYATTPRQIYFVVANGSNANGYVAKNVTGWHHAAFTFDGSQTGNSNRLKIYFDGVNETATFAGTIPSATSNNAANEDVRIGQDVNGTFGSGEYAEIGAWQATLNAEEISSLYKGMKPNLVRPDSLVLYTPLVREIQDVVGGITLTDTNTTVATHPRVYA